LDFEEKNVKGYSRTHFLLLSLLGLFRPNDYHVRCNVENYRAITLGPVIAKVFESIVAVVSERELQTDDLQFGF